MHLSSAQLLLPSYLRSFSVLEEHDIEHLIQSVTEIKILKKGESYVREGDVAKDAAFVFTGILRCFYISEEGDDFTYCITFPNKFISAYSSFISGLPTDENTQAIIQVELPVFDKERTYTPGFG